MRGLRLSLGFWAAGLLCLALALTGVNPAVTGAERYARDVAEASAVTYVSLRAINAALSVAEEVELGGNLVVSATAQPLNVLEPVDDTVERVSAAIFVLGVVSGVLSLGFSPLSVMGFGLAAAGFAVLGLGALRRFPPVFRLGRSAAVTGLFFAIALPLSFAAAAWLGQALTQPAHDEAAARLGAISAEAGALIGEDLAEEGGEAKGIRSVPDQVGRYLGAAGYFLSEADALFAASLSLIAIYLLRLIVLPLILVWAAMRMLRATLAAPGPGR